MTAIPAIRLPRVALYFPSIEFKDEAWLRAALCIWDHIERIVPPEYVPQDSDDVRKLQDEGLVRSLTLSPTDMDHAATSFEALLKNCVTRPSALATHSADLARLHKGKVGERLHDFFRSVSQPVAVGDSWFGVPVPVCHAYMMHLAECAAARRNMTKVTDCADSFAVVPFVDSKGTISADGFSEEDRYGHAVLGLMALIPRGVGNIPISQLLAFRNQTAEGRHAFGTELDQLATDIAKIEDPKTFNERLNDVAENLELFQDDIRKQYTYNGGELGRAVLSVGLPVMLSAFTGSLSPQSLAGHSIVALTASMATAYGQRRNRQVSPARSYYVALENTVASVFVSRHCNRENAFRGILEEYIND